MKAFVGPLQVFAGDVRVYLRGRNVSVAQHLLYRADIGIVLQHIWCKTMPISARYNRCWATLTFRPRKYTRTSPANTCKGPTNAFILVPHPNRRKSPLRGLQVADRF